MAPAAPPSRAAITLVVNGDDFGYSAAINAAILRCHEAGVLRSTSVLLNQRATRAALALARSRPSLGVGLHVNLTEGAPVLPPAEVPSLTDRRGFFCPLLPQLGGLVRGRTNLDEVERELRAQFGLLLDAGIRPTHVDGHLHAHAFPGVLPIVVRLMAEFGVRAMRSPLLTAWLPGRGRAGEGANGRTGASRFHWEPSATQPETNRRAAARLLVPPLARSPLRLFADAQALDRAGIVRAGYLLDAARYLGERDPAAALAAAAGRVPGSVVEAMAHPAWNRDAAIGAAQVALLTDPRLPELLARHGVRAAHYGEF